MMLIQYECGRIEVRENAMNARYKTLISRRYALCRFMLGNIVLWYNHVIKIFYSKHWSVQHDFTVFVVFSNKFMTRNKCMNIHNVAYTDLKKNSNFFVISVVAEYNREYSFHNDFQWTMGGTAYINIWQIRNAIFQVFMFCGTWILMLF